MDEFALWAVVLVAIFWGVVAYFFTRQAGLSVVVGAVTFVIGLFAVALCISAKRQWKGIDE